jgi:peptidoglycan/xylan/chitin deacetylase (PgdA/CDA1 family)
VAAASAVAAPLVLHGKVHSAVTIAGAVALALVAFLAARSLCRHGVLVAVGVFTAGSAAWVLTQSRDGVLVVALGALVGFGAGLAAPTVRPDGPRHVAGVSAAVALAVLAGLTAWTGANSPSATWFGGLVSHGPRDDRRVALTFDDGPNVTATLGVRDLLDAAGAKGTFFLVGKALDARPDIARALLDDGHLLANHSYHHDSRRWLDPRYLELGRTQRTFAHQLGVCPAFFRPPHGQHTPFMAHVVSRAGMRMVTWDVSVGDWATHDAAAVARRVLSQVRPGSIIDLHDGLDGNIDADRSVVVRALPAILAGIHDRGLTPVRLDELLGVDGYLAHC